MKYAAGRCRLAEKRGLLTARTGRHGLKHRLAELGYKVSEAELEPLYKRFLDIADKKTEVFDEDIAALCGDERRAIEHVSSLYIFMSHAGRELCRRRA